ncbi:MAG: alkaline phosphatase D family protein [Chitinophagales bacterium]
MKQLFLTVSVMLALALAAQTSNPQQRINLNPTFKPFYHGVESGDPTENSVMIWTRCTPDSGNTAAIPVNWQIATDLQFTNVVNYGKAWATEASEYTVKVDVCGLQPATYYYYMFSANGRNSIVGRTKTAPAANSNNDSVRFAVVSCASWEHGFFNTYENIAARNDVDAVVHLGDYIYEYQSGDFSDNNVTSQGRVYDPPQEIVSAAQYEGRYSQYKLDDQLKRVHQLFPFITVWDDHETCNDAWREGGENHQPATEGPFDVRKHNSTSAYFLWMPLRKPDPLDTIRIFRRLRYGKLLDLIMLDTRLYDRDEQNSSAASDPNRHMMGPVERAWYFQQLTDSTTRWKIVGNQVMLAPMLGPFGLILNPDQWDGYKAEQQIITNFILNSCKNVVILTGDIHTSWCNDVPGPNYNSSTGAGSACVEFVGPSATSFAFPVNIGPNLIKTFNPHEKYVQLSEHGYYVLDVKKGKVQAEYRYNDVITLHKSDAFATSYYVNHNERFLRNSSSGVPAQPITAANPSATPDHSLPVTAISTLNFIQTDNRTPKAASVIPNAGHCPALVMTILDSAHYGRCAITNGRDVTYTPSLGYQGPDTVWAVVCETSNPTACDTVLVAIQVRAIVHVDTTIVNIQSGEEFRDCYSFDDVVPQLQLSRDSTQFNALEYSGDTCFKFTASAGYCGFDVLRGIACETVWGVCDTVVYVFKVNHPAQMQTLSFDTLKNNIINYCFAFDDLVGVKGNNQIISNPKHGNFTFTGDSCAKYSPYYNYTGNDTVVFRSCDNCTFPVCDTLRYIFNFREPQKPNAIVETDRMVVLGMFPNPVDEAITVQYYLYKTEDVQVQVTDALGKVLYDQLYRKNEEGLHHALVPMKDVAAGTYQVRVVVGNQVYTKRMVKR